MKINQQCHMSVQFSENRSAGRNEYPVCRSTGRHRNVNSLPGPGYFSLYDTLPKKLWKEKKVNFSFLTQSYSHKIILLIQISLSHNVSLLTQATIIADRH